MDVSSDDVMAAGGAAHVWLAGSPGRLTSSPNSKLMVAVRRPSVRAPSVKLAGWQVHRPLLEVCKAHACLQQGGQELLSGLCGVAEALVGMLIADGSSTRLAAVSSLQHSCGCI
jgi:hypothetical protein